MSDSQPDMAQPDAFALLAAFTTRFDRAHYELAAHAAFVPVLTPDLLYRLWANFVPQAPWAATANLLLSPLCREIGPEMVEMDPAVQRHLLADLHDEYGPARINELAHFLTLYASRLLREPGGLTWAAEAGRWLGLAHLEPKTAAAELADRLQETTEAEDDLALGRLGRLINNLAESLAEFQPLDLVARTALQERRERAERAALLAQQAQAAAAADAGPLDTAVGLKSVSDQPEFDAMLAEAQQTFTFSAFKGSAVAQMAALEDVAKILTGILAITPDNLEGQTLQALLAERQRLLAPFEAAEQAWAGLDSHNRSLAIYEQIRAMSLSEALPISTWFRDKIHDLLLALAGEPDVAANQTVQAVRTEIKGRTMLWCEALMTTYLGEWLPHHRGVVSLPETELAMLAGNLVEFEVVVRPPADRPDTYRLQLIGLPDKWYTLAGDAFPLAGSDLIRLYVDFHPPLEDRGVSGRRLAQFRLLDRAGNLAGAADMRLRVNPGMAGVRKAGGPIEAPAPVIDPVPVDPAPIEPAVPVPAETRLGDDPVVLAADRPAQLAAAATDRRLGTWLNQYQLEEIAGQGTIATVYRAKDGNLRRMVAVKIMHSHLSREEIFRKRFFQEARNMAAVNHPNLVRVFDVIQETEDTPFLVYEFMAGGTLRERLKKNGRLDVNAPTLTMLAEICDGLAALHGGGIVNRDLTPDNIMFTGDDVPKITGSTLSKSLSGSQNITRSGEILGTLTYMAPEQLLADGDASKPADMYSFGVVLYECFSGRPLLEAKTLGEIARFHTKGAYPSLQSARAEVPVALNALVMRLLAREPKRRLTAAAAAAALHALAASAPAAEVEEAPVDAAKEQKPAGYRFQIARSGVPGQTYSLTEGDRYVIGRRPPADIVLPDQRASRRHCEISMEDGFVLIQDLGSTNGTFGNQYRLEANKTFRWQKGQIVTIGEHTVTLIPLD